MEYLGLCISFAEMESSKLINYSINICWIGWDILSLFFVFGEILSNFHPEKYDFNLGSQILFFFKNSLLSVPYESGGDT